MSAPLPLLLLLAFPAFAQYEDAPAEQQGEAVEQPDEESLIRGLKERLQNDPGFADALAGRINRSKIADRIAASEDPNQRQAEIRAWIDSDPGSAAGLAFGLAKDDANGTHSFEDMITRKMRTKLQVNPNSKNGIFGRLKKTSKDSLLMKKQGEDMTDEEKREILKTMFEGQGGQSGKILTQQMDGDKGKAAGAAGPAGASAVLNSGYFDRLSQGNLRGYSPQLQAMQSALNARRVPGAPKLIETGKLDYETLSYPGYGMKFDVGNLEKRLIYERNYALAKLLGLESQYTADQLMDPNVEAALKAKAAGKALPPRFAKRQAALERAAAAVRDFDAAALEAKDPAKISRQLLVSLGSKQKEAARWITVASLEEELNRLDLEDGFMSAELMAAVRACPVDAGSQDAYLRRGDAFSKNLKALKANDENAVSALEADDWLSRVDEIEKLLIANGGLRKDLSRNIADFRNTAFRFAGLSDARPSWRRMVDEYVVRFLPSSAYARGLKSAQSQRALLKDVFMKIAMGNLDAAHTVLASYEPNARR